MFIGNSHPGVPRKMFYPNSGTFNKILPNSVGDMGVRRLWSLHKK